MKSEVFKKHCKSNNDTKQFKKNIPSENTHIKETVQLAKSVPNSLTRGQILQLQKSIGNRAVMQLLKNGSSALPSVQPHAANNTEVIQKVDIYWREDLYGRAVDNKPQGKNITFLKSDNRSSNNERYKDKSIAHDTALKVLNVSGIEDSNKFNKYIKNGDEGAQGKYTIYPNKIKGQGPTKVLVNHTSDSNAKISRVRVANGNELAPEEHTPIDHYHAGYYNEYVTENTQNIDQLTYHHVAGSADHYYIFK